MLTDCSPIPRAEQKVASKKEHTKEEGGMRFVFACIAAPLTEASTGAIKLGILAALQGDEFANVSVRKQ